MKSATQQRNRISKMSLGGTSTALAMVILLALVVVTAKSAQAQTFTTLLSFNGANGSFPFAGLIQGTDGNLYGNAYYGGAGGVYGTVFKIAPSGKLRTLHSFCSLSDCADGDRPQGGLVEATNGDFYGATSVGGANGDGTVFKITASGKLTTLHSFCSLSGCADGSTPVAGLVQATNGSLYGTATQGGANDKGTVFEITETGTLTTIYNFCSLSGCADGYSPQGTLMQASDGDLYGTTFSGGAGAYGAGGTIFKITPSGTLTTVYNFCSKSGCADGCYPQGGLVQGANGDFYGTTLECSIKGFSTGTIFKITPSGKLTTLHSFCSKSGCKDGENPDSTLVQAANGNFYGAASVGGANAEGTVFEITPTGTLTTLYNFCAKGCTAGGYYPVSAPFLSTNGLFYGTTYSGGADGAGTIYSLSAGLGPFVGPQPTFGNVGAPVTILGTNLTGATSVAFNGTTATFKVKSSSEITTKVPTGATTGTVQVVTPSGTLSSNVPFQVVP